MKFEDYFLEIEYQNNWVTIRDKDYDIGVDVTNTLHELDFVINSLITIRQELLNETETKEESK